jgi:hypothetical protein
VVRAGAQRQPGPRVSLASGLDGRGAAGPRTQKQSQPQAVLFEAGAALRLSAALIGRFGFFAFLLSFASFGAFALPLCKKRVPFGLSPRPERHPARRFSPTFTWNR